MITVRKEEQVVVSMSVTEAEWLRDTVGYSTSEGDDVHRKSLHKSLREVLEPLPRHLVLARAAIAIKAAREAATVPEAEEQPNTVDSAQRFNDRVQARVDVLAGEPIVHYEPIPLTDAEVDYVHSYLLDE